MQGWPVHSFQSWEDFFKVKSCSSTSPRVDLFDVVNKVRHLIRRGGDFKKIKVGHAGTLDPLATGVLVLCTGRMTKRIAELSAEDKAYDGHITFGANTDSHDLEMPLIPVGATEGLDLASLREHALEFHRRNRTTSAQFQRQKGRRTKSLRRRPQGKGHRPQPCRSQGAQVRSDRMGRTPP